MKICVITGTRAEYGLLRPLMKAIQAERQWLLQVVVTGAHLSPEFGLTYKAIEADGFQINKKVEMLLSGDTPSAIIKSMAVGMIGYSDAFTELSPDLIVVLGDRYEMLSVASSALILKIPIAHIHGGEITEGAYDDAIRHSISKMSHLHFVSTETYKNRIIQMGEQPDTVFNVGAIGIDNIRELNLLTRDELEKSLNVKFLKFNYQVTFHPATMDNDSTGEQFQILLNAIKEQKDSFFVFTKANADSNGRIINKMIDEFTLEYANMSIAFTSLGTLKFLSLIKVVDAVVGNSSSGIIEAPSLHTATINVGDRQKGRIQAESVLNTKVNAAEISSAIKLTQTAEFKNRLENITNPYGEGNTTDRIMEVLRNFSFDKCLTKKFYDII
ncbi:GDP/UDP-N,N'-diacetylbacillosamine 2-epimerase (hydrolysing) [Arachidicoccus rhizosphaerae]|uniref:GDP/UDP-N,N'-diacetylbacillosamine 2-epimerase (Hydrolysing) n=1 Tax=Arachidicoccus rhizosphaerae TaxID=551991 RepID=A0A1H4CPB9_9BACT|nr:UDP-N-acetylglucosamine 2-epimerase [Arachidicoccus rhizosphaerae]SEA62207.1 GDP/UDP-N,N'-diacetylbacillosamine 2-epimerase (hydrolysing) [Arachidicoccus rhizosphaerae]